MAFAGSKEKKHGSNRRIISRWRISVAKQKIAVAASWHHQRKGVMKVSVPISVAAAAWRWLRRSGEAAASQRRKYRNSEKKA